jgi:WD40 repeat protein
VSAVATTDADDPDRDAERALRDAMDRGEPGAALRLADLVRGEGRAAEAEKLYRLAAERGESGAMVRLGDMLRGVDNTASEQAYREALTRGEMEAAVRLGDVLRVEGRLEDAGDAYRLGFENGDVEGRKRLGEALTSMQRFDEAAALYRDGLKRGEFEMAVRLGDVLQATGDLDGAEEMYRRAVDRGDPEANTRLGDLYLRLGRSDDAFGAFERGARTGDPDAAARAEEASREMALPLRKTGWVELQVLPNHQGQVFSCAFSPDGKLLASASDDGTAQLWDLVSATAVATLDGRSGEVFACAFASDGRLLASAGQNGQVRLWDVPSGRPLAALTGHSGEVFACAFAPDGKLLASTGEDGTVRLWELASRSEYAVFTAHRGRVWGCAFSPDGRLLASTGEDGTVNLWDLANSIKSAELTGHRGRVAGCAFSPDGKLLASASEDETVRLWDLESGTERAALTGHRGRVTGCAFSPDGQLLATTGVDGTVRLWDVASGPEPAVLTGHRGRVTGCAFSPDGQLLATTGVDGTVRLWRDGEAADHLPAPPSDATLDPDCVLPAVAPDVADGVDLLGVGADVRAISNLVAASDTVPPLSIGLFGDWGSGKSFFIGQVRRRVQQLAYHSQRAEGSGYCAYVRNISFNAWHYADANLWASLVTHIFDELAKPDPESGATTETAASAQVARLEEKLAENSALKDRLLRARVHRRRVQARRNLLRWTWGLTGVESERSLGDLQNDVRRVRSAIKLLVPNARARLTFLGLAVFAALGAFAVVVFAGGEQATRDLVAAGAAVAVPLSVLTLARSRVLRLLEQAGATARAIDVRETDIDAELELANAAELELQRELSDLSAGRRLARMASERSGDYREHLGLVSRIHDDFVRMSELLHGEPNVGQWNSQAEDAEDGGGADLPRIDRIVLYIDDLDRCPPRRVMEVLEAVHLILAVPLFVVVVAVDPRWLLQSLKLHYAELLAQDAQRQRSPRGAQPEGGADSWGASPIDYLEKIIQVPFTLQPMNNGSAQSLVYGLLPAESLEDDPAAHEQTKPARPPEPAEPAQAVSRPKREEQPGGNGEPLHRPENVPGMHEESTWAVNVPSLDTRTLVITQAERDFAATVAAGLRTPRTVKKFTNLYRLLRAGLDERSGALERFLREGTGDATEYQAVLILLAAIIAFADDAPKFLAGLLQPPTGGDLWIDYLRDVKPKNQGGDLLNVLNTITTTHGSEPKWTCEPFRQWALQVSRYSFTTGQEVFAHFKGAAPPPPATPASGSV